MCPAEVTPVARPCRPDVVGFAGIHCDGECLVGLVSAQGAYGGGDVNVGVVFGGHDDKGSGLVVVGVGVGVGRDRLIAALDDVFVAQALNGQDEGSIERDVGDIGAIHRDGVGRLYLDAFLCDGLVGVLVMIAMELGDFYRGDVVGVDAESLRPSRQRIRHGASAVALGTDEHLVGDPAALGVVSESVVHE